MGTDIDAKRRVEVVDSYFRKVDARDPSVLDLFTEDVQMFFPKFGVAHGKAAMALFSQRMDAELESLEHDINGFHHIVSGDFVVVEGTESGVTRDGLRWPDGVVSQGRFCNVFEFEGALIKRAYIYVDPDFTGADIARIRALRDGKQGGGGARAIAERLFTAVRTDVTPEAIASMFSEAVDWDIPGDTQAVSWIGRRRGRAGVAAFFRELRELIESIRFDIHSILADGDKAVVLGDLASRVSSTGKVIESEFAIELTVEDGLIVRYRMYEDSVAVARAVT